MAAVAAAAAAAAPPASPSRRSGPSLVDEHGVAIPRASATLGGGPLPDAPGSASRGGPGRLPPVMARPSPSASPHRGRGQWGPRGSPLSDDGGETASASDAEQPARPGGVARASSAGSSPGGGIKVGIADLPGARARAEARAEMEAKKLADARAAEEARREAEASRPTAEEVKEAAAATKARAKVFAEEQIKEQAEVHARRARGCSRVHPACNPMHPSCSRVHPGCHPVHPGLQPYAPRRAPGPMPMPRRASSDGGACAPRRSSRRRHAWRRGAWRRLWPRLCTAAPLPGRWSGSRPRSSAS